MRRSGDFSREKPLVVALTGTDVYRDIHQSAEARESLELAHRLIVLQPKAAEELRAPLRKKVRVVVQSSATALAAPAGEAASSGFASSATCAKRRTHCGPSRPCAFLSHRPSRSSILVPRSIRN